MFKMFSTFKLMLIPCVIFPLVSTELCGSLNCDCFENKGRVEYHCPRSDEHKRLVIKKPNNKTINWTCKNVVGNIDKYLPDELLHSEEMTISDCPLTTEAAISIDFENIKNMWIKNSTLSASFVHIMSSYPTIAMQKLVLSSVRFDEDVTFDTFNGTNLTTLVMQDVDINYGHKLFENQSTITNLDLKSNYIKLLKETTFENLVYLESLDLSENHLVYLHTHTFKGLFNLKHLFLNHNLLEVLEKAIFKDLKNLKTLALNQNGICLFHKNILKPLKSLELIELNNNNGLLELDDHLFSDFPELKSVSIRSSNLKRLPENLFRGSTKIKHIDFGGNKISHIPGSVFDGLSDLQDLLIGENEIKTIDISAFNSLSRLKKLVLSNNKIQRLESELLLPLVNLEYLEANSNKINYIGDQAFVGKERLRIVYLSWNQYKHNVSSGGIPFAKCSTIEILDLSSNLMENVPEELFEITNLKSLIMDGNKLQYLKLASIWKAAYKGIMINLEGNKISKFVFNRKALPEEPDLDIEEEASYVFLSENPLHCDCSAKAFLDFINLEMERSSDWGILFVFKELECASPKNMKGKEFHEINQYITGCNEEKEK